MNKKIRILFIDYSASGFKRYAKDIVLELSKLSPNYSFNAVYMDGKDDTDLDCFDKIVSASAFRFNPSRILDYFKPDLIMVFAHRFFDYMFTIEARKRHILVCNFQHGFYMDNTVVSKFSPNAAVQLIKKKKNQIIIYTKCIYYMNHSISGLFLTIGDLLRRQSLYGVVNKRFGKICNADISFVFGEYWKSYYMKQYKELHSEYHIVGYPELEGAVRKTKGLFSNDLPIICYLAQTSVEDGVINTDDFNRFIEVLYNETCNINLIIKLHPRSDKRLYSRLLSNQNVMIWDSDDFPIADCYIGHESTVVARALYISDKTMVCRLAKRRKSPYEKFTKYVCAKCDSFSDVLKTMINSSSRHRIPHGLEQYVFCNNKGAIKETASIIYNALEGRMH